MINATIFSFLAAITILTLTPGFDTALVLRTAIVQGWQRACATVLGVTLGCLLWGVAVGVGLGALLMASEIAYNLLKWMGAGWLLYLGIRLLLKPRQQPVAIEEKSQTQQGYLACFSQGLTGNLLNPKIGIFYVTFLPQFIPAGAPVALWCTLMALAHMLLGLVWNAVLIGGSHYFAGHLRKAPVLKAMDRLTGCVFIGFAAKLALSRR